VPEHLWSSSQDPETGHVTNRLNPTNVLKIRMGGTKRSGTS